MLDCKQLNLGSGDDIREGFINVDIRNLDGVDFVSDARDLKIFHNGAFDFVVAQHLLEYIPRADMIDSLLEWKRLLSDGGRLEIRSTDISKLTKALYLNGISPEMGMHDEMVVSLLYGQQLHEYDTRHNGFSPSFLQGILRGIGLKIQGCVLEDLDFILTAQKPA